REDVAEGLGYFPPDVLERDGRVLVPGLHAHAPAAEARAAHRDERQARTLPRLRRARRAAGLVPLVYLPPPPDRPVGAAGRRPYVRRAGRVDPADRRPQL